MWIWCQSVYTNCYTRTWLCEDCSKWQKWNINLYHWEDSSIRILWSVCCAPWSRCLKQVTSQVVNHEGSVIVICATSLDLGLIQPHNDLNASIPDCRRLIFCNADHPNKYQNKKIELGSSVFKVPETEVNQYVTKEVQDENKQQHCPAQTDTVLEKRKGHRTKSATMRSKKSKKCAIRCKTEHKGDQIVMLPHKPAIKMKKPGQETHKDVLQYKNYSDIFLNNRINDLDTDKLLLTVVIFLRSEENVFPANFVTPGGVWENVFTHKIWVNGWCYCHLW